MASRFLAKFLLDFSIMSNLFVQLLTNEYKYIYIYALFFFSLRKERVLLLTQQQKKKIINFPIRAESF